MSPGDPEVPLQDGAERPPGHDRIELVGYEVADKLLAALPDAQWFDAPTIQSRVERVPLSVEAIGYAPGEFDYPYGGVYCGQGFPEDCDPSTSWTEVPACVPFSETYPAPNQTEIAAGQIGDMRFVTFPGEPGTLLAEAILDRVRQAVPDTGSMLFMGYTLDYTGYSILEDDWYQGGYEAGGALWGPRQGAYLSDRAVDVFTRTFAPQDAPAPMEPAALPIFDVADYTPVTPMLALGVGEVVEQVSAELGPTDTAVFAVKGEDPWLGAPVATLRTAAGDAVTWHGGQPVTSDSVAFFVELDVQPPYSEPAADRTFTWRYSLPVQRRVPGGPTLDGAYRIDVELPGRDRVLSEPFSVVRAAR